MNFNVLRDYIAVAFATHAKTSRTKRLFGIIK